jgi:hypothetical protein
MAHVRPTFLLIFLSLAPLFADQPKSADVVVPTVSLSDKMPLRQALKEVQRQSGVILTDTFGKDAPDVALDLDKASFWRAVDAIAVAANAKAVQSGRDGSVVFQPFPKEDRRPPVSYDGPFRVRVSRITVSRDLESERGTCTVNLDVTWTPTLRPLFLESQAQQVKMRDGDGKDVPVDAEGSSLAPIDGRYNLAVELSLPALSREQKKVGFLEGKLIAVAPTKMVRFDFDRADLAALNDALPGGAVRRVSQDEVVCQASKIVLGRESWSVQMTLDYPEGNRKLESFQLSSLVANNELLLTSKDGKRRLMPTSSVIDLVGSRRAVVTYHFADRQGAPRGKAGDWKVTYAAPARVVEVAFRFAFKDLPLP